jgi:hypothetical protein
LAATILIQKGGVSVGFDYDNNEGLSVCVPSDPYTDVTVEKRGKNVLVIRLTADYVGSLDVEVTPELAEQLVEALWSKLDVLAGDIMFRRTSV